MPSTVRNDSGAGTLLDSMGLLGNTRGLFGPGGIAGSGLPGGLNIGLVNPIGTVLLQH